MHRAIVIIFLIFSITIFVFALPRPHHANNFASSVTYKNDKTEEEVFKIIDEEEFPTRTCSYESCPVSKENVLNVHIVPHSHDDVGWLKTVDQYYWGSRSNIQLAGVQYILDSVVRELIDDPNKRFIYVETAFFWKWWKNQNDKIKKQVQMLVNEGRLEFIGGAWAMNDEAVVHYTSTIDQFSWGLRRLNDTFGDCGRPKVGWQIDPFGHSREQASLFAQMGYDGFMFGRLDYQDKSRRVEAKEMEMIWQGSESLGTKADIFTHALYNTYSAPNGFCFDILCGESPLVDDKESPEYNIDNKVIEFIGYVKGQAERYTSNNVIITMGGDFTYQDAHYYFKSLDKLIRNVNLKGAGVRAFYSSPSCYLKSVHQSNLNYTVKTDDFFPYCSDPHACWTGYFTSRPTIKYFERQGYLFSQVSKQLDAMSNLNSPLDEIKEAVGIMQHHDAITGTEKQHVAFDYARILHKAVINAHKNGAEKSLKKLVAKDETANLKFKICLNLNISECDVTEHHEKFVITVYNPLSHSVDYNVRVPVKASLKYKVQNASGIEIDTQIIPVHPSTLLNPARKSDAKLDLLFKACKIPPLGFLSFFVSGSPKDKHDLEYVTPERNVSSIGYDNFRLNLHPDGSIKSVTVHGEEKAFTQSFAYYYPAVGNNEVYENRSSGAYIFRNNGSAVPITVKSSNVYKGTLVSEVHQTFSVDWVNQVVRLYKDSNHVEVQWMVGPIPVDEVNQLGKEVITKYSMPNLSNSGVFYTDSNGREMLRRTVNYRPTWNYEVNEPVAGNYYPVTSRISLRGNENLTVFIDRAQGGSSLNQGEVELMVHRRLLHDDAFGVGEALNETTDGEGLTVYGHHYVAINSKIAEESVFQLEKFQQPWLFFSPADSLNYLNWTHNYNMSYSGLRYDLPTNVHILTLEAWKDGTVLLRLEHIMEKSNGDESIRPVTVNIEKLFTDFDVLSARETTLAANQWLSESERLNWKRNDNVEELASLEKPQFTNIRNITLNPMEIRTFVLEISYGKIVPNN